MYDLRKTKTINLNLAECLKDDTTYKFKDSVVGKNLIAKFISNYDDSDDIYLITEFKKLALLSGEPEIATVYYITSGEIAGNLKNCYIMDFIEGTTLQSFLEQRPTLIFEVAFDVLLQLANGMEKAHNYGIFHNDLHNENIMIDKYGYLKLIDFLWWDYNLSSDVNRNKDLDDFKRIANELFKKCKDSDKKRFKLIKDYCNHIKTFKGLGKELQYLEEISFEFSLLNKVAINILSKLFDLTENINNLEISIEVEDEDIPEKFNSPLTDQEQGYIKNIENPSFKLGLLDTRISRIESELKTAINLKLYHLKQIDVLDWRVNISNTGKLFIGPYKLNYRIWFTSKFFKWKKIFELLPIIEKNEKDLEKLIID